jgi:hypothetical protein
MMTDIEYRGHLQRLALISTLVADVPIAELHNHVTHAETLGPILEPTAWIRGGADNLTDARDLIDAAAPLVSFGERLQRKLDEAAAEAG